VQANPSTATTTLAGITGEQISGDLLTATIWSWFAAAESHNRLSQNQANMIENQGLSYGLFHAIAQPVYSWGVIRAVKFPGVNMDIGHVRPIGWSKDNDRNTWIAYNKLRGQYMSALEHAIPERFFNDPSKCNPEGTTTPVAGLPVCPQGISAVKAIGLAAAQGQKIYTITQEVFANNPNIVSSNLSAHSYRTQQAVQNALYAGNEVTIHERPIMQSGWTGSGYTFTDPQTGAGGYIIDGGTNGGWYSLVFNASASFIFLMLLIGKLATAGLIAALSVMVGYYILAFLVLAIIAFTLAELNGGYDRDCGGISTCNSSENILKIASGIVGLILITAGLSGNLIALVLGIILLRNIALGR
jgi:hypothetical protein